MNDTPKIMSSVKLNNGTIIILHNIESIKYDSSSRYIIYMVSGREHVISGEEVEKITDLIRTTNLLEMQ